MTNLSKVIAPGDNVIAHIWLSPQLGVSLDFASGHERSLNKRLEQAGIKLEGSRFDSNEAVYIIQFTNGSGTKLPQVQARMLGCIQNYIAHCMGLPPHKRVGGSIVVRDLEVVADGTAIV